MALYVSISGANKRVVGVWVGVAGVWKKVTAMHTSVVGTYKLFFTSGSAINPLPGGELGAQTFLPEGASGVSSATMRFMSNGSITAIGSDEENVNTISGQRWFSDLPDTSYEVYATLVSATGPGSTVGTFGAWIPISSQPSFGASKGSETTVGARVVTAKFKIRRASDRVVVSNDTNNYSLAANVFRETSGDGDGGIIP